MKTVRRILGGALLCIVEVVVGVLLLIDPVNFTNLIVVACGLALVLWGFGYAVRYFRTEPEAAARSHSLSKGLALLFFGGVCILRTRWLIEVIPMMTMVYGVMILLSGIGKIQWGVDLLRGKKEKWFLALLSALVSMVCSAVILCAPFASAKVLWIFTGISLICEGFLDVVTFLLSGRSKQPAQQLTVAAVPEAEAQEPDFVGMEDILQP